VISDSIRDVHAKTRRPISSIPLVSSTEKNQRPPNPAFRYRLTKKAYFVLA
jgi:hypothetical protein